MLYFVKRQAVAGVYQNRIQGVLMRYRSTLNSGNNEYIRYSARNSVLDGRV